jgi:hypothetical protein
VTSSADRCRNCGLLHKTYNCPSYGPMFPAPGKSREDYAELNEKIQNQIAKDVLAEHYGHDDLDDLVLSPRAVKEEEAQRRSFTCDTCGAQPGKPCVSKKGEFSKCHKSRYDQAKVTVSHE